MPKRSTWRSIARRSTRSVHVDAPLIGDLRDIVQQIAARRVAGETTRNGARKSTRRRRDCAVRDIQNLPDDGHLYAAHVINALWRETKGTAIVATDVGQHQMWEAQYYHHEEPRSLITSGGLGTMGFALPAGIGAKFAKPDAEVWVIAGDGGFQMTMPELATIVQERYQRQDRDHQQRLPGDGAAVAAVLLRGALRGDAAAES
jgi:acetolactate synthase-1/2/3 large subunit